MEWNRFRANEPGPHQRHLPAIYMGATSDWFIKDGTRARTVMCEKEQSKQTFIIDTLMHIYYVTKQQWRPFFKFAY